MKIALIAHDKKKEELLAFVKLYVDTFKKHELYATGTTGTILNTHTGLKIKLKKSGPLGGDQEIGSMVANGKIDFFGTALVTLSAKSEERVRSLLASGRDVAIAAGMNDEQLGTSLRSAVDAVLSTQDAVKAAADDLAELRAQVEKELEEQA